MEEHASGIEACEEAISLISSLGGGGSFIQLKGRIKSVSKKLTEMTKLGDKFEAYAPLISSLAEIASKAEPNVVTKILDLLRELKAQIETTRAADEAWEQTRKELWESELADLTNQRNNLTTKRNNLTNSIENYTKIITDNQEKFEFHSQEAERYKFLLEDQIAWCEAEQ